MKTLRNKNGFSLIELLTVIAIIAILAAIIFPVMSVVKNRARETQCMTNLHDIAIALKMFQQDNRRYPESIAGFETDQSGAVLPLERVRNGGGLYPEYIKATKGFHCPLSPTTSTSATVTIGNKVFYAYSSYDVYTPRAATGDVAGNPEDIRYTVKWADDVASVIILDPGSPNADPEYDYKRQLRFRNPSDDTVVTWCSYHKRQGDSKSPVLVLFLDGHVDKIPAINVEGDGSSLGSRWRTEPKR